VEPLLGISGDKAALFITGLAFDQRYPWMHGVWHLFVLAGSISHYVAILVYV